MKLAERGMKLAKNPWKRVAHPETRNKNVGSELCADGVNHVEA